MSDSNAINDTFIQENNLPCKEYKKGEYIYREGDPINGIYLIHSGAVFIINEHLVLWTAEENELIGISSYMSKSDKYKFSARVHEPTRVYKITKAELERIIHDNQEFAQLIIQKLCRRIELIDAKTRSFMGKSSRNRLIEVLINQSSSSRSLNLPYQLNEFSELVGVSTRRVKSMLKELEDKKLIRQIKNQLEILDLKGLEIISRRF